MLASIALFPSDHETYTLRRCFMQSCVSKRYLYRVDHVNISYLCQIRLLYGKASIVCRRTRRIRCMEGRFHNLILQSALIQKFISVKFL